MNTLELAGVAHEVRFWKGFVQTPRFLEGWLGTIPNPELQPIVRDFLLARPDADVLDVGSGVTSLLAGTVPPARLVAVDPLSEFYAEIFDYSAHELAPPLPIAAEELPYGEAFDVVHMSNALDHSHDPVQALMRLQAAARPGGYVIVQGFENEGTAMGRAGMHQWDLRLVGPWLLLGTPGAAVEAAQLGYGETHSIRLPDGRDWLIWIWRKPA